jgi:hypothetical protein
MEEGEDEERNSPRARKVISCVLCMCACISAVTIRRFASMVVTRSDFSLPFSLFNNSLPRLSHTSIWWRPVYIERAAHSPRLHD